LNIRPTHVALRSRKIKSGVSYFIDYPDPETGKRIRLSLGMDKKKAELRRSEIEWKLFKGEPAGLPAAHKSADFGVFLERFLDHCRKTRGAQSVLKDHGRHETLRKFFIEEKQIGYLLDITPGLVQELQAAYLADHSRKGWNCLLSILKNLLNRAVDWGVIDFNPIARLKPLKTDKTFNYFKQDEIERMLAAADPELGSAILILLHTGMRRSELWNLRWRDVNLKGRTITIKPHGSFRTKSGKIRSVSITEKLYKHLKTLKQASPYVCRPYEHIHTLRKNFVKLLEAEGLSGRLHDLRHTFASHLAMANVPIPVIKELLGHSDITTTMIYAHLQPDIHRDEINKLPY
jgi:integrase